MPKLVTISETQIKRLKVKDKPYRVACGLKLYLLVHSNGTMYWHIRAKKDDGKMTDFHIGKYPEISLVEACRIRDFDVLNTTVKKKTSNVPKTPTFKECALRCIDTKKHEWKNEKHGSQWLNTLNTYAYPVFGNKPIDQVDRRDVLAVLEPIWIQKTETATRLRGRIEAVINWAKAREFFKGDNPACWEGGLKSILPNPSKVQKVENHASMPYEDIPALIKILYQLNYPAANALKMTIFTACRTSEVLNIKFNEINKGIWTIPSERMKAGKEHKVPLPNQVQDIIRDSMRPGQPMNDYIFLGLKKNSPLSTAAMTYLLKRLNFGDVATVHGFRSSFRMWAAEQTNYPREVCEQALAHKLLDKVEAAYMRSDFLEKRKQLMQDWANYITSQLTQDIIEMHSKVLKNGICVDLTTISLSVSHM